MNEIYLLTQEERELFFQTAANIQNMPFEIIEKDFWVVWILGRLFSLEKVRPYLTFKGGTSLSKVYRLIDRFSEDIDLSSRFSDSHLNVLATLFFLVGRKAFKFR
jgi:predicted nucleotidyltransferase component of viral defense system